jgi:hypothetical protein
VTRHPVEQGLLHGTRQRLPTDWASETSLAPESSLPYHSLGSNSLQCPSETTSIMSGP